MPNPSFDARCYDLAEHFLADTGFAGNSEVITELAVEIQATIEDFISELEVEPEDE